MVTKNNLGPLFISLFALTLCASASADAIAYDNDLAESDFTILASDTLNSTTARPKAYFLDTVLWPYNASTKTYPIPVCWENTSQTTAAEKN